MAKNQEWIKNSRTGNRSRTLQKATYLYYRRSLVRVVALVVSLHQCVHRGLAHEKQKSSTRQRARQSVVISRRRATPSIAS